MDRDVYESSLRAGGFDGPAEVSLAAGERRTPHTHDFAVRGLVLRGEFILASQGGEVRYGPGDPFVLERGCEHFEAAGPEGASYLVGRKA